MTSKRQANKLGSDGEKRPTVPPPVPDAFGTRSRGPSPLKTCPSKWTVAIVSAAAGTLTLLGVLGVAFVYWMMTRSMSPVTVADTSNEAVSSELLAVDDDSSDPINEHHTFDTPLHSSPTLQSPNDAPIPQIRPFEDFTDSPIPDSPEETADDQRVFESPPLVVESQEDALARSQRLKLPPVIITEGVGVFARQRFNDDPVELIRLEDGTSQTLTLSLSGGEFEARRTGEQTGIVFNDQTEEKRWQVVSKRPTSFGGREAIKVATFAVRDDALWFNWEPEQADLRLTFCTLTVTMDGQTTNYRFDWDATVVSSVSFRNDEISRIDIGDIDRFFIKTDVDFSLELKFSGMENSKFGERGNTLTFQQKETTVLIPLSSFFSRFTDTQARLRLSFGSQDEENRIAKLRVACDLYGPAYSLDQNEESIGVRWQRSEWQVREISARLDESGLEERWEAVRKLKQAQLQLEKDWRMLASAHAPRLWRNVPVSVQRVAVGGFSALQSDINSLSKEVDERQNDRDEIRRLGMKSPPGIRSSSRKRDEMEKLEAQIKKIDEEVKGLELRLRELQRLEEKMVAKHPELPKVFEQFRLSEQLHRGCAEMHLVFGEYVDAMETWRDEMRQFVNGFRERANLDYRLYLSHDGREIDLVVTEGFRGEA